VALDSDGRRGGPQPHTLFVRGRKTTQKGGVPLRCGLGQDGGLGRRDGRERKDGRFGLEQRWARGRERPREGGEGFSFSPLFLKLF
jgi:hypothetical protein